MQTDYRIGVLHYPCTPESGLKDLELQPLKDSSGKEVNLLPADGITLPLRLGRLWKECVTCVVSEKGFESHVKYGLLKFSHLPLAQQNVASFAVCKISELGYVNTITGESSSQVAGLAERVKKWAMENKFDVIIWFEGIGNSKFIGKEIEYLKDKNRILHNTKAYIRSLHGNLSLLNQEILSEYSESYGVVVCQIS